MPFKFSEIPLLVSPVVCHIQVAAKLNLSKASAKLITVTASYLSKAQYSRKMLKFLCEFTVSSALIPNLTQVWLNYFSKNYTWPGLTGICISLKETGPCKKHIILSWVWAESQYPSALNCLHSIHSSVYEFVLLFHLTLFYFTTITACTGYIHISL